jgi:hypothetical protein
VAKRRTSPSCTVATCGPSVARTMFGASVTIERSWASSGLVGPRPGPMRPEQGVLAHQPKDPFARDARARPGRAAAPGPSVRRGGRPADARLFRLSPRQTGARPGRAGEGRPGSQPAGRRPGPWAWGRRRSVGRLDAGVCAARRATWNDERGTSQTVHTRATPWRRPLAGETEPAITATACGPKGRSARSSRAGARFPC